MAVAEHVEGQTEWWVQNILQALLQGLQRPRPVVLECGGYLGHTSEQLLYTLYQIGGGELIISEWDPDAPGRAVEIDARLQNVWTNGNADKVKWSVRQQDAIAVIQSLPDESLDFAYLDDDHSHEHVDAELNALFPKMKPGGLICGHDVHGSTDLRQEFKRYGGIALDLPRLGPAGGLGIIQI